MKRPINKDGMPLMFGQRKAVNKDGSVRFVFTEKAIDRYDEVVIPTGARLEHYRNNPIALWAHGWGDHESIPIGKTLMDSIEITEQKFEANIMFDESGDDPFSKMIATKVKNGFLNACSIGFRAITTSQDPVVEGQRGLTFLEWELFEISICAIPALPSALVTNSFSQYRSEVAKKFGEENTNEIFSRELKYFQGMEFEESDESAIVVPKSTPENIEEIDKSDEAINQNAHLDDVLFFKLQADLFTLTKTGEKHGTKTI